MDATSRKALQELEKGLICADVLVAYQTYSHKVGTLYEFSGRQYDDQREIEDGNCFW